MNASSPSTAAGMSPTSAPPQPPSPTTYTMRCPWTTASTTGRPARVAATSAQLVILNALYARTGQDPTKVDVEEASRETGLQEKWIRKWIKRQRTAKGRAKKIAPSRLSGRHPGADGPGGLQEQPPATLSKEGQTSLVPKLEPPTTMPVWQAIDPLWSYAQSGLVVAPGISSGSGDGPSSAGSSRSDPSAVQDNSLPHTLDPLLAPLPINAYDASQTASHDPVQVAHPGTSFTVPLRSESFSQHRVTRTIPAAAERTPQPLMMHPLPRPTSTSTGPPRPTAQGYHSPEFFDAYDTCTPSSRAHFSDLAPPHIPTVGLGDRDSLVMTEPPLSVPPSAFSMPSSGVVSGGAYLYHLFNYPASSTTGTLQAPPFHSTYHFGNAAVSNEVSPNLWSPASHGFVSPVIPGGPPGLGYSPTPVSYQMRLSDLIALTKSIRAVAPGATESEAAAASQAQVEHALGQSPDDTAMGGEDTEDEHEAVTPCEEVESYVDYGNSVDKSMDTYGKGSGFAEMIVVEHGL